MFEGGLAPTFSFVGEGRAVEMEALLRPVVEAEGFDLYDVSRRREGARTILQVMVDRPDGVDIDALAGVSERIAQHLDAEGSEPASLDLRVSSPGLERALKRPEHFQRALGEQVKVKTTAQIDGSRTHTGLIVAADDEGCTLDIGDTEVHVPYADISSARTVVDWGAELKRSNA